jgi:hypothetical protein
MTDNEAQLELLSRTGKHALSVRQILDMHLAGRLPALPGQGMAVRFVGSALPYADELGTFHQAIAEALVQRRAAVFMEGKS